jgi:hypothetical protein
MSFSNRPYAQLGIAELETLVQETPERRKTNEAILAELYHRKTAQAHTLQARLETVLGEQTPADSGPPSQSKAKVQTPPLPPVPRSASVSAPAIKPLPTRGAVTNDPQDILRMWTVLEVLSPSTFKKPADLAGGDLRNVARFSPTLPWEEGKAKAPAGRRLYFQIVLGSVVMQPAIDGLLHRFADSRPEKPKVQGETPLAVVIVDSDGCPTDEANVVVSSFAWGLPLALTGDPAALSHWGQKERAFQAALYKQIYREGEDGNPLPLDHQDITAAYEWLIAETGIDPALTKPPTFAIRSLTPLKSKEPPAAVLLNSFFLDDLEKARQLVAQGQAPDTLKRFLGTLSAKNRRDLLQDQAAIEDSVAPERFPLGRWPGPGRHPLVLMQQAAVNLATTQKPGEILAVNGPPGTGKTTLLRDVIAALMTARASEMAKFDDPATAFKASGQKLNLGGAWLHLYQIDPRLKGFEMVVASSNNKAVENVSGELPALKAVADDALGLRYLKPLADGLTGQDSWGAIAAVLGNSANRTRFKQKFWWDEDTGLFPYLKAVEGKPTEVTQADGHSRPPRIVSELDPPRDHHEALRRWQAARTRFTQHEHRAAKSRADAEHLRRQVRYLPPLERAFEAIAKHALTRPGFFQRLFALKPYRAWKAEHMPLSSAFADAGDKAAKAGVLPPLLAPMLGCSPWLVGLGFSAAAQAAHIATALRPALADLQRARAQAQAPCVDATFFANDQHSLQTASPWFSDQDHRQRDELFEAALDLHRAFIDAAAKPLRHNLGAALQILDGKGFADGQKDALIPDLWSSLFLVVPAMSTTFASVGRMLRPVPSASLGWLLVDEAGQAAPQQAVGALMRANRAIVVGDPIQVPPVVLLPDRLTAAICQTFGVDAGRFAAPTASTQTLADDATAWCAEFPARMGSRTVGVPLLVHRRCSDPMFSIANQVAYENLMVQAKTAKASAIATLLGPSRWIDVVGTATEKWCPEEGQQTLALIEQIVSAGLKPDLYMVTPFVQVAEGLRKMLCDSAILTAEIPELQNWVYQRVGTVHTVQGREAEAVIFVLGAPNADQGGARAWAGQEPNLLNVAVTRAKEAVYVVGNRQLWKTAGVFSTLDTLLARWEQQG